MIFADGDILQGIVHDEDESCKMSQSCHYGLLRVRHIRIAKGA
eukprot:CAMPEP_0113305670 /NCGR_PEP_ID=MMETSP0010_2-20120614/5208_1 /TAXON_ID=216773 ORGANISM="Corethron hystrix, Strain 308" /NCGR_SAMPLE_ID=MMETSP0010_2 /ASSEMBLY_ACC=CAM_ASM_000155 /LENGTH=42 /DNA_ID=CAMNT_0000160143 /DNA_START=225 /DNA_END=353 /DNA_ORIENTATION=- /assembly_acc=CAM_ASM_000155